MGSLTCASSSLSAGGLVPSEKNPSKHRRRRYQYGKTKGKAAHEQRIASKSSPPSLYSLARTDLQLTREVITIMSLPGVEVFSGTCKISKNGVSEGLTLHVKGTPVQRKLSASSRSAPVILLVGSSGKLRRHFW